MPTAFDNHKVDYDITYPPGVKEISEELSTEELVKRLKICSGVFQNLGQNDNVSCYENFALHIASEEFMNHSSKEAKLLVACIIVDIFRVFAPNPPYKEPYMIKNIFTFLVEELKGIKSPTNVYFKRHFYLLENLAWMKAFNICFDIDEGQEIFCKLFKLFFNVINEAHSTKVRNYMLDIMSSVLIDIDNVSNELLESILVCIIEPYKTQRRDSFNLAKDLIKRTYNILEPYIQPYFTTVLFPDKEKDGVNINELNHSSGDEEEQDKKKSKDINNSNTKYREIKVYDFIHELYILAPGLLTQVLPLLDFKLKSDKSEERLNATKALGRMFSEKDSNLASENPALWKSFLGRFNDIDTSIRLICVCYVSHLLMNHKDLLVSSSLISDSTNEFVDKLSARALDPDEAVRLQLVLALVEASLASHGVSSKLTNQIDGKSPNHTPWNSLFLYDDISDKTHNKDGGLEKEKLIDILRSRTLDKKFRIRKEATMGLGNIYKAAYAISSNSTHCNATESERRKLYWIRDQCMHSYYQNTIDDQILVERVFNTCLVPFNLTPHKRMYRLLHLFVNIDEHSVKAWTEMWKKQFVIRTLTVQYIDSLDNLDKKNRKLNSKANTTTTDASLNKLFQISRMLPEPIKAFDHLKRLDAMFKLDDKLFKMFGSLVRDNISCKEACQICKNILKKMGNPQATNALYTNVKQFLERVSPLMIDANAIECLCRILDNYQEQLCNEKSPIYPFKENFGTLPKSNHETSHSKARTEKDVMKLVEDDMQIIKDRGFRLLQILSCVFVDSFYTKSTMEHLSQFIKHKDDAIVQCSLQVLTNVVKHWNPHHNINNSLNMENSSFLSTSNGDKSNKITDQVNETDKTDSLNIIVETILPSLQKLCKTANSKQTKYGVICLFTIINHKEILNQYKGKHNLNPSNLTKSLFKHYTDNLKKPMDSEPFLNSLSGLGQISLLCPDLVERINSEIVPEVAKRLFPHSMINTTISLKTAAKLSRDSDSSNQGVESVVEDWRKASAICQAGILRIKLECKTLSGIWLLCKRDEARTTKYDKAELVCQAKSFYAFLFTCLESDYESFKLRHSAIFKSLTFKEFILLKLKCACAVLRLVQIPVYWDALSLQHFQTLAYLIIEIKDLEFKQKFIYKIHKALLSMKLPLEYLAIFCLVHNDTNKEFKLRCKQYLAVNISKRREILRTNPNHASAKIYSILPDYVLPYAVHLLAHHPAFHDIENLKLLEEIKDAFWFLIEPLIHKNENYSFSFFKRLIENIKQTKDAQSPESSHKLYAVCDIALGLIWTRSSTFVLKDFPAKPILPSKLFTKPDLETPNSKIYLPKGYAFSPPRKKITRPELCQFFSLSQDSSKVRSIDKIFTPVYSEDDLIENIASSSQLSERIGGNSIDVINLENPYMESEDSAREIRSNKRFKTKNVLGSTSSTQEKTMSSEDSQENTTFQSQSTPIEAMGEK
ncbi:sister chromatid cohesion protein PDS5 homolog A-like isoform X2 [Gordionus sp. m RMFG-2023]|uniref:sister chromatid cohesion protein PDS5 homolog A-like isoform X2 n=1 Tax=Gordionus sp. m RMFG-2023 TaxID=3053472 RepID=UPI0031FD989E